MRRLFLLLLVIVLAGCGGSKHVKNSATNTSPTTTATTTVSVPTSCAYRDSRALPDPKCTPGLVYRSVTQSTISKTICVKGWTSTIRPPVTYTEPLKFKLMKAYGDTDSARNYELDHLIPLELGGNPISPKNLWPEPHDATINSKNEGSYTKDGLENSLRSQVCNNTLTLAKARYEMRHGTWLTSTGG